MHVRRNFEALIEPAIAGASLPRRSRTKAGVRATQIVTALCLAFSLQAGAKDKLDAAIERLQSETNYSWTTTTREADGSSGRLGDIEGKTQKKGLTYFAFTPSGVPVEVYLKGTNGIARALEGWQTLDEIAQTSGSAAAIVRMLRAYKLPAAQSDELAKSAEALKENDGVLSGDLKEGAVNEMLLLGVRRREGQDPPKTSDTKGAVKFWLKDGALSKYQVHIEGKVTNGDRVNEINRTLITEIKDPGTTKIELPADATQKMPVSQPTY